VSRAHPVQEIIDHHLKNGMQPPEFRKIRGKPDEPSGMEWWVKVSGVWMHACRIGRRQFVDGREL